MKLEDKRKESFLKGNENGCKSRSRSFSLFLSVIGCLLLLGCSAMKENMLGEPAKPPVTVPQIILMSREGVSPDVIIAKMQESGTVYRLKADQLAQLKEEGVSDAVIDYMQQTYLNAVRSDQSLEDWDNWTLAGDGFWYGGPWWWW